MLMLMRRLLLLHDNDHVSVKVNIDVVVSVGAAFNGNASGKVNDRC
jgi:hypothetical protein